MFRNDKILKLLPPCFGNEAKHCCIFQKLATKNCEDDEKDTSSYHSDHNCNNPEPEEPESLKIPAFSIFNSPKHSSIRKIKSMNSVNPL
jgi:hypothetical protein